MKRYQEYMDSVEASAELHERLTGLTAPKQAAPWKRYGALAAALALAVGVGAYGLSHLPGENDILYGREEIGESEPAIDIAPVEPGTDTIGDETNQTDGGYEQPSEDGRVVSYYALPAIIYNEQTSAVSADYALAPPGALSREATLDDVTALVGSREAMKLHLLWGGELSWSGVLWFLEDGSPCAAALWAEGDDVELYLEMMAGSEVPGCVVYPDESYETTTFCGVEITALKNTGYMVQDDGTELRESREVSCFADGVGYKLTIYGVDGDKVEAMCARFARWAIVEGFDLSALTVDGAAQFATDSGYCVGEPNWEDGAESPSQEPADEANTSAYDSADTPVPNEKAPN